MNYKEEIEKFVIQGFEKVHPTLFETHSGNNFLLKNRKENFITIPEYGFDYHRWAGSLKSSQAFAYNIFSGVKKNKEFEFHMKVFNPDAQVDVMIKNTETNTIELFEVKMFEIISLSKKKIEFKGKYFDKEEYLNSDIALQQIEFLHKVVNHFEKGKRSIYTSGIKQLCSHLFGIINEMTIENGKLVDKKVKLYSFCFDNLFSIKFEQNIENYKSILIEFKVLVDEFLKDINFNSHIEYFGYQSAKDYVEKNKKLIGEANYNYVMKRYFYNNFK
jgi:hypothetical protein